jgi:hypothetical protein
MHKKTAIIETGMAGKSSWDPGKQTAKIGLVWRIRKKISKIIKDYLYLPFFLLIILWCAYLADRETLVKCRWIIGLTDIFGLYYIIL